MPHVVADADVASYIFKRDSRAERCLPLFVGHTPILSFMTVAELRLWTRIRGWGKARCDTLETYISRYVVRASDDALCDAWPDVVDSARRRGRLIGVADAWVAATALVLDVPLVTNSPSDYAGVEGLRILTA